MRHMMNRFDRLETAMNGSGEQRGPGRPVRRNRMQNRRTCWRGCWGRLQSGRRCSVSKTGWKPAERDAASILHGQRFPANTGGRLDGESPQYVWQVKNRRTLSLKQIEALAEELERIGVQKQKPGLVLLKRSAGRGRETPWLIVVTAAVWREITGGLPTHENAR